MRLSRWSSILSVIADRKPSVQLQGLRSSSREVAWDSFSITLLAINGQLLKKFNVENAGEFMYGKIFESCFTGSMVGAGAPVFAVWSYIIANAKPDSMVELNPVLLSAVMGEPIERIEQAIEFLSSPDPKSRTKSNEGRRLSKEGEFLYFVPNRKHYQDLKNNDERREYNRVKKQESRMKKKAVKDNVNDESTKSKKVSIPVSSSSCSSLALRDGDSKGKSRCTQPEAEDFAASIGLPRSDGEAMFLKWHGEGWGKVKDWKAVIRRWKLHGYLPSQKTLKYGQQPTKPDWPAGWSEKKEAEYQAAQKKA